MIRSKLNKKSYQKSSRSIKRDQLNSFDTNRIKKQFYFYFVSLFILIAFIGGSTMVLRSNIGNIDRKIMAQEAQIDELTKTKKTLIAKIDGIKNSDYVIEDAKFKLGMVYPEEEQLVYIEVKDRTEENDVNQNVYLSPVLSVLKFFNRD